jgi:hypothetical protein
VGNLLPTFAASLSNMVGNKLPTLPTRSATFYPCPRLDARAVPAWADGMSGTPCDWIRIIAAKRRKCLAGGSTPGMQRLNAQARNGRQDQTHKGGILSPLRG